MPISDAALENPKNRFIAVRSSAKLGQAAAALTSLNGRPWWHVVVQRDDGSWGVARFNELGRSLASATDAAEVRLGDAQALRAAPSVERSGIETKAAQALARKSLARVLVVTDNGRPVGILVEGVTRGGGAPGRSAGAAIVPSASLEQLGGKYIKLQDYGSILLGGSKK